MGSGGGFTSLATDNAPPGLPHEYDCKRWALSGEHVGGLTAVAGYVVLASNTGEKGWFTEHWWCVDGAGNVVDATGIARLVSQTPGFAYRLIPNADQREDSRGVCLAYEGACRYGDKMCAWCANRATIAAAGNVRQSLDKLWRPVVIGLLRRVSIVESEVESLKREFASMKAEVPRD